MKKEHQEKMEATLGKLNSTLREQLIDTKLVTIEQWNKEIAPKLSAVAMALNEVSISPRTYRLPNSYFE